LIPPEYNPDVSLIGQLNLISKTGKSKTGLKRQNVDTIINLSQVNHEILLPRFQFIIFSLNNCSLKTVFIP